MILYTLIVLAVIVVGLVIIIAMQPDGFRVTRSSTIPAPASTVFEEVNDFHNWQAWSPWARMDPAAKNSFAGSPSGAGAVFTWAGNKVGAGKMTLLESKSSELIRIKLEFLKPFPATNSAEFTFKPAGDGTLVTWSMSGKRNFMFKAFGLFMDCDKMCGSQFEQGLQNLTEITTTELASKH